MSPWTVYWVMQADAILENVEFLCGMSFMSLLLSAAVIAFTLTAPGNAFACEEQARKAKRIGVCGCCLSALLFCNHLLVLFLFATCYFRFSFLCVTFCGFFTRFSISKRFITYFWHCLSPCYSCFYNV